MQNKTEHTRSENHPRAKAKPETITEICLAFYTICIWIVKDDLAREIMPHSRCPSETGYRTTKVLVQRPSHSINQTSLAVIHRGKQRLSSDIQSKFCNFCLGNSICRNTSTKTCCFLSLDFFGDSTCIRLTLTTAKIPLKNQQLYHIVRERVDN